MADCLNGAHEGHVALEVDSKDAPTPRRSSPCIPIWMALLSAVAVALLGWSAYLQATVMDLQSRLDKVSGSGAVSAASGGHDILLTLGRKEVESHTNAGSLYRGSGAWAQRKPLPESRSDMAAVLVECNPCVLPGGGTVNGSRILVLGGLGTENNVSSSVLMYDPLLDDFTQLAPMPVPRFRFGAAVVGEEVYVVGGFDAGTDEAQPLLASQVYNTVTGEWREGPSTASHHGDTCAGAIGSKVYVVAGYGEFYNFNSVVEELDTSQPTPQWRQVASLPEPRGDVTCAVTGDKLYVAGGYYDPTGAWVKDSFHSSLFEYDPSEDAWTARANMSDARGDAAMVATFDGELLVMGGEFHARNEVTQIPLHSVEMFNPEHESWTVRAPLPLARFRFAAVQYAGEVFAFGGHVLCKTGWFDDWADLSCPTSALDTVSVFLDLDHPDVFLHIAD